MTDWLNLQPDDVHNLRLRDLVHPANWTNPTPTGRYNLVVVGAGTAGLISAIGAAGLGAKVALIERSLMGGDCLNVGCVPSKALLAASRRAASLRHLSEYGLSLAGSATATGQDALSPGAQSSGAIEIDFPAIMERVRRLRTQIAPNDSTERYRGLGVDVFLGQGQFTGPDRLSVAGQELTFSKAIIATGARAATLDLPGLKELQPLTNETVFNLTELPRRLTVIGGGPIGCELAQAFARLGSQVTLISRDPFLLPKEDRDAARLVQQQMEADGVTFFLGAETGWAERGGATVPVPESDRGLKTVWIRPIFQTTPVPISGDEILVAVGRRPNVDGLGLEAAGVRYDIRRGVEVNDQLRTANPRILAAGDICSKYQFTHAAEAMAKIALRNALFLGRARASQLVIPRCTYTEPEVAQVGLTRQEADEQRLKTTLLEFHLTENDRTILEGEGPGLARVLLESGTDRILGATIVGPQAGELLAPITLAMTSRLGLSALYNTISPYPTRGEVWKRLGGAYFRTRLTPFLKSLFTTWLRWTR